MAIEILIFFTKPFIYDQSDTKAIMQKGSLNEHSDTWYLAW